jgi:hypothetical protein
MQSNEITRIQPHTAQGVIQLIIIVFHLSEKLARALPFPLSESHTGLMKGSKMKRHTLLLSLAAALVLLLVSAISSYANDLMVDYYSDGSKEGTYAVISWERGDGSAWQVLGRSSLWDFLTGEGPLVTSRTVHASRCQVPFGRGESFSVRFLDGTREGQIRSVKLDYPSEILLAIGEAEADATVDILAAK